MAQQSKGSTAVPSEHWKSVAGFPTYDVSSTGYVRSRHRSTLVILSTRPTYNGYPQVELWRDGRRHIRKVHRLAAEAFLGSCPVGLEVRHLDGDKLNNAIDNLTYGTRSQNMLDLVDHGNHNNARKTHCKQGHEFDAVNTYPWRGKRKCRTCIKDAAVRFAARKSVAA